MAPNEIVDNKENQTCAKSDRFFTDLLPNTDDKTITKDYIKTIVEKLTTFLANSLNHDEKIINFLTPEELEKAINFNLPDEKQPLSAILKYVDDILKYVVKTAHPRCYNQLWAGIDINCLMGEWIASATNTSMYTYEMAPVYVLMEKYVFDKLLSFAGFPDGEAFFFPGGSVANMEAIILARHRLLPDFRQTGMYGLNKRLILYTSTEGHYSTEKAAMNLGLGSNNLVQVKTDDRVTVGYPSNDLGYVDDSKKILRGLLGDNADDIDEDEGGVMLIDIYDTETDGETSGQTKGKIIPSELEKEIENSIAQGDQPFFVCATSGTTVRGAYDPLNDIADVCEKHKIWLHVDGAWGASCLMSRKHRHLMDGLHRADSLAWDPHKMMNVLQQCAVLLTKTSGEFLGCNSTKAKYLFQKDKKLYEGKKWDNGDKTFQCGRRNDVLKLWLMWKAKGTLGIEEQVDLCFSNARYLAAEVKKRPSFKLIFEPECGNVCFQYLPPSISLLSDAAERSKRLDEISPEIKKRMTIKGSLYIGYQPLKEHKNFFRMITMNPASTPLDMDFVLDEIERLGKDL